MEDSECSEIIHKKACIEAKVKVNSDADAGEIKLDFIGEPKREPCDDMLCPECEFVISQLVCLKIPISFSAEAKVVETRIACEKKHKDCEPHPCDDIREHGGFIIRRSREESKPARSFAKNYVLTYENNPEL